MIAAGLMAATPLVFAQPSAQSSVTIYGMLDIGLRSIANLAVSETRQTLVDDASRSRIGFRMREDMGGGLSAFAQLEHSLRVDTGAQRDPARLFDDKAWVGLEHGSYGSIALGRLRSPIDEMTSGGRFETFGGFSLAAAGGRTAQALDGWDNAAYYITPRWNGFKAGIGAKAGEGLVRSSRGLHAEYSGGPLDVGLAFQQDGDTMSSSRQSLGGGMAYQFKSFKVFGTYVKTWDIGQSDAGSGYTGSMGVRVPWGPGEFRTAYRRTGNSQIAGANNRSSDVNQTQFSVGYHYPLSKRTSINTSLVRQTRSTFNAAGAAVTNRRGTGAELALRLYF